jgi:hypothetical protein
MFFGFGRTYTNGVHTSATSMPIPIAVATPAITSGLPNCFSIFFENSSQHNFLLLEMRINRLSQ